MDKKEESAELEKERRGIALEDVLMTGAKKLKSGCIQLYTETVRHYNDSASLKPTFLNKSSKLLRIALLGYFLNFMRQKKSVDKQRNHTLGLDSGEYVEVEACT